jgi:1-acyl-sn-glycerol-3-phosphate acyltransferase
MVYSISKAICAIIFKILFRIKVCGREYIPKRGAFILASNHVSYLDPPALGIACPRKLNYMARHDLFSFPLASWWFSAVGVFPVKRNSADILAFKTAMRRLKNGEGLLLFPEGTRQETAGLFGNPEPGIGFLASKFNCPVIPAFVRGTEKAFAKGAKFIAPKKIFVYFGKQIHIERGLPYQTVAKLIMENIRHLAC